MSIPDNHRTFFSHLDIELVLTALCEIMYLMYEINKIFLEDELFLLLDVTSMYLLR